MLSGSASGRFVEVDNSDQLSGYNSFDLQITTDVDWTSAALVLTLTQGEIYQHIYGSNFTPPSSLVDLFPQLAYDTYIGAEVSGTSVAGGAGDLGSVALRFDDQALSVSWFNIHNDDIGTFSIARITLSEDAVGTWSYITLNGQVSDSGTITAGSLLATQPDPEPDPDPSPPAAPIDGDFDEDGMVDILWRNNRTGATSIWTLDGTTYQSTSDLQDAETNTAWRPVGLGDFTGDSKTDTLWRNSVNGRLYIEAVDSQTAGQHYDLTTMRNLSWQVAAVADFTGDGQNDILWRHTGNGRNIVWEMDGTTFQQKLALKRLRNTTWHIGGTGDFNGDGDADILWRNQRNGRNTIWYMKQTQRLGSQSIRRVKNTAWHIAQIADYTGDGRDDILWRHTGNGRNTVWQMNGTAFQAAIALPGQTDQDWQVAGPMLGLWEG